MKEKLIIRCCELEMEERILYIRFFDDMEIDLIDVKEIYDKGLEMANGKSYCALADVRNSPESTPEARAFGATLGYSKYRLADAILTTSVAMKLIVNSYIKFNKPKVPTKMFVTESEAIKWLKTFLENES
jgi:hypothetical protein